MIEMAQHIRLRHSDLCIAYNKRVVQRIDGTWSEEHSLSSYRGGIVEDPEDGYRHARVEDEAHLIVGSVHAQAMPDGTTRITCIGHAPVVLPPVRPLGSLQDRQLGIRDRILRGVRAVTGLIDA